MYEQNPHAPNNGANIIITILIPTRNRVQLLRRTLLSVVKHAVPNMEVCVVDNNSDAVASNMVQQMVDGFEQLYPSINWQHAHSQKPFAAGARNDGIKLARGQYICLLDDDDELLDNSLSLRLKHMQDDPDIALLYCAAQSKIYPYPIAMYRYYKYDKTRHRKGLMMMSASCIIINKKIFADNNLWFDESLRRMEDYDLCRQLIRLDLKVKSIPQALVKINLHPDTRMSSNSLGDNDFKDILVSKWGHEIKEYLNCYGEGVFIWRKCFGLQDISYIQIDKILTAYMGRKPSASFKVKYRLIAVSPICFVAMYHISVMISQFYKNRILN